tara:strand:+ start:400 stop:951 length:552 start_codon:yes stop_codon:yes gene_type:complete
MSHRYKITEFVLATNYRPKLGRLYFIGADGNLYETSMGPKSKGYKAPMVAELNIKREEGWLYYVKRNPGVEYVGKNKKARVPKESICEIWRNLMSSEYGIKDMTKEEMLKEILEDWNDVSNQTDEELNEDRGEWIKNSRNDPWLDDSHIDPDYQAEVDLHTIAIQLEQIKRFGSIVYQKKDDE